MHTKQTATSVTILKAAVAALPSEDRDNEQRALSVWIQRDPTGQHDGWETVQLQLRDERNPVAAESLFTSGPIWTKRGKKKVYKNLDALLFDLEPLGVRVVLRALRPFHPIPPTAKSPEDRWKPVDWGP